MTKTFQKAIGMVTMICLLMSISFAALASEGSISLQDIKQIVGQDQTRVESPIPKTTVPLFNGKVGTFF